MGVPDTQAFHVLLIAHRVPYPPNKGDKIRAFHQIRFLSEQGGRVHLCALADDPVDLEHVRALKTWCSSVYLEPLSPGSAKLRSIAGPARGLPLSARYFYRKPLQRRVDQILDRYPVGSVLCYCGPTAEYVLRSGSARLAARLGTPGPSLEAPDRASGRRAGNVRLVMDLVDIDSDKWRQYSEWSRWPWSWVYRLESVLLARYETRVARTFDATVLVSPAEAEAFRERFGLSERVHAVGNGVDLDYFRPLPPGSQEHGTREAPEIVFCGLMDYLPNVDAVTWFGRQVLPRVRDRFPSARFTVVGARPAPEVEALVRVPGIRVTGAVPDVRPYVWAADVCVAPIRIARGVQNKVLEAMAMGRPVVATPQAFEGIAAEPGRDLAVAPAEPGAFARAVIALLDDPDRARSLGRSARSQVERTYRWEEQLAPLGALLGLERQTR